MNDLSDDDRAKLSKILGLLTSEHAGERAAAGLKASDFVRQRGMTWSDILQPPQPGRHDAIQRRQPMYMNSEVPRLARALLQMSAILDDYELQFLLSMTRRSTFTAKQIAKVEQIRLHVAACRR